MPNDDREKWNAKYANPDFAPHNPSQVLQGWAHWFPKQGRMLDVAGGCGRHSIWLGARRDATLIDISSVGLRVAQERAAAAGIKIRTLEHDVMEQGLPAGPWDLIVSVCFLWHPTPAMIREYLAAKGVFAMVQPTTTNLERHPKPPREFLMQPGELAKTFSAANSEACGLRVIHCSEGWSWDDRHDAVLVVERE